MPVFSVDPSEQIVCFIWSFDFINDHFFRDIRVLEVFQQQVKLHRGSPQIPYFVTQWFFRWVFPLSRFFLSRLFENCLIVRILLDLPRLFDDFHLNFLDMVIEILARRFILVSKHNEFGIITIKLTTTNNIIVSFLDQVRPKVDFIEHVFFKIILLPSSWN